MLQPLVTALLLSAVQPGAGAAAENSQLLETVTVTARRVANLQPASSFAGSATALRFDPQVNLQSRGLPEGQSDITVRGGLFENTGFRLGAVTLHDPQTGHYAVEIPLDPAMLTAPEVMTDFDNGLNASNASVATISYGFAVVSDGNHLVTGAGTDNLLYASYRGGKARKLDDGDTFGTIVSVSGSRGDGSVPQGDHEFGRFSGQLQWKSGGSETNILLGYHDKFAGWPGMYTGFANLPETDHTKLALALADHRRETRNGWWQMGLALRELENDYDFDRRSQESGTPGSFEHETRSVSLAVSGVKRAAGLNWHVNGQFTSDRLLRSTDLTWGRFNSRSFAAIGVAPQRSWRMNSGGRFSVRAGLRADFSNRDENAVAPLLSLSWEQPGQARTHRFTFEYARSTQLPGYTALNSRPTGLFGGNPDLGREYADTLKLAYEMVTGNSSISATVFHRSDDDLVDWTSSEGAPFARQANAVDIEVHGFEALYGWRLSTIEMTASYAFLDKTADYGSADVDASFYALNFARHRATLAVTWQPVEALRLYLDTEYRIHEKNALRQSGDEACLISASIAWQPSAWRQGRFMLVADNLLDDDFQEFPGTPPMGRQVSLGLSLDW